MLAFLRVTAGSKRGNTKEMLASRPRYVPEVCTQVQYRDFYRGQFFYRFTGFRPLRKFYGRIRIRILSLV